MDYCDGAQCRHRLLVRHFGQDLDADCGEACDICLGELEEVGEPLILAQKILSSVYRQDQKFGADYTAKVLKGSKEQRILENGHDRLSTHGLLQAASRRSILDWIGQLIQQGFLIKDGEYSILRITADGWRVLRGELTPRLLQPASGGRESPDAAAPLSRATRLRHDPHSWEGVDRGLFEALRTLRTQKSSAAGLPPYMIFGDAALRDMGRRRPTSAEGFLKVHGVGQKKCGDYAAEFTTLIADYCRKHELQCDVEAAPPSTPAGQSSRGAALVHRGPSPSLLQAFELFDAARTVEEVAETMGRALSTTRGYFHEYLRQRRITDPTRWVAIEQVARIERAVATVGPKPLKAIWEHLGGEVDYDAIHIVSICWQNRQAENTAEASGGLESPDGSDRS
jgi:ATP-dependent DNA helicase RecQ